MAWYWPFTRKNKHVGARNGGTVRATVETPIEDVAEHIEVATTNPSPRTVEEYVASQIKSEPVSAAEYVLGQKKFAENLADAAAQRSLANPDRAQVVDPIRLLPAEYRFRVGDKVLTVNGSHVWEVVEVEPDYSSVLVRMRDSRGRLQAKRYHPSRLARSQQV